jgi:ABC-type multidrug transport system fused ATPase/permease subunit
LYSNLAEGTVSLERLTTYFNAEEIDPYVERPAHGAVNWTDNVVISVKDGYFSWSSPQTSREREGNVKAVGGRLVNLNMDVKRNQVVAIVGTVGSGAITL